MSAPREAVAPQHGDGAIDPARELDVEGDDPDGAGQPGIFGLQGVLAREPGGGGVEQVGGADAAGEDDDGEQGPTEASGCGHS